MVPRKRRAGEYTAFMAEQKVKVIEVNKANKGDENKANNNNNNGGKRRCNCKKAGHEPINKAIIPKVKEEKPAEDVKLKVEQTVPIFRLPPLDPAAVNYVRNLPPSPAAPSLCSTALGPMVDQPRMTLVLDVDETLVHCTSTSTPDVKAAESFQVGNMCVNIKRRPFLQEFLDFAAR